MASRSSSTTPPPSSSPRASFAEGSLDVDTICTLYADNPTPSNIVDMVLNHVNELGGGDLPPFISITKLEIGKIYTIQKMVKRVAGEDNAPYTGIQVYLNKCRTSLPRKYLMILFL